MKKLLYTLLFVSFGLMAQNDKIQNEKYVADFSDFLIYNGASSFMQYQRYCNGNIDIYKLGNENACMSESTNYENYFFWIEEGKTYIKKMDNCGLFETQEIASPEIVNFISENIQSLKENNVKPYETAAKNLKIEPRTDVYPCMRSYSFTNTEQTLNKTFRMYDLTSNADYSNINLEYNQNLKLVALNKLVEQAILDFESSNQFRRTNKLDVAATTTVGEPKFTPKPDGGTLKDGE